MAERKIGTKCVQSGYQPKNGVALRIRAALTVFLGKRRRSAAETESQIAAGNHNFLKKFDQNFNTIVKAKLPARNFLSTVH